MWKCRHCNKEFDLVRTADKANHSRWCQHNPKRNDWNTGQATRNTYGDIVSFDVQCSCCGGSFVVKEREKLFPSKQKYFCSRKCANSVGGAAKRDKYGITGYVAVAEKFYKRECAVCGVRDILDVHHIDEDRSNYHPSNLIFLCPNDHYRLHRNKDEQVLKVIEGHGTAWGGHFTCNEDISGVQTPDAPPKYFR